MKNLIFIFSIFLTLVCVSCSNKTKETESIINKMITERGNPDFLKSLKNQTQIWIMNDSYGNTFRYAIYFKDQDKLREVVTTMDGNPLITTVYNNGKGYQDFMGTVRQLTPQEIEGYEIRCSRWFIGYMDYAKNDGTFERLADEKIDNIEYYVLKLTSKNNQGKKIFVDKKTGLEGIIEERQYNAMTENWDMKRIILEDYKDFGGIFLPSKMQMIDHNNSVQAMEVEKIINEVNIDDSQFNVDI
jgi:hypothetical protein